MRVPLVARIVCEMKREAMAAMGDGELLCKISCDRYSKGCSSCSPGDNSPLQSSRQFKDFELTFEFHNDGDKAAVLGFGEYSEQDSHPVRIYLSGNHPGWQKLRLTAKGRDAGAIIESIEVGKDPIFPEAVIRAQSSTLVPLVFKGPNLRLRNIKIRPLNNKPVEK